MNGGGDQGRDRFAVDDSSGQGPLLSSIGAGREQDPRRPRRALKIAATAVALIGVAVALYAGSHRREIRRLRFVASMFSGADQVSAFRSMESIFPTRAVRASGEPFVFPYAARELPASYEFAGAARDLGEFLDETDTSGLLVLKEDAIAFEAYYRGNDAATRWISWSVAKSFVSALVGVAISEHSIDSVEDAITDYVPELRGSGYDGVRIKDVLQMSSGVAWDENYSDPASDINRMGRTLALGFPLDDFVATLRPERKPGTFNRYVSMDTQALAMLIARATGKPLASYLEEKIWRRIGMESDAYWITDDSGTELAFGGLNATLRDYARFGRLYLNGGRWGSEQVVPAAWVQASVTPDAPHLQPGENPASDYPMGYGYQWWIPQDADGEFMAIGVYNQFIYVYPRERLVIAKTSANHLYGTTDDESSFREFEHVAVFRAIAAQLRAPVPPSPADGRS